MATETGPGTSHGDDALREQVAEALCRHDRGLPDRWDYEEEYYRALADAVMPTLQRQANEVERLSKLAEANGNQARFWADHFAEIDQANRDALGDHHKPGHTVAELLTDLVGEVAREKKCYSTAYEGRARAWEQLRRIAELMGVEEDDVDVTAVTSEVERYVDQVKFVTERLTRERDEAQRERDRQAMLVQVQNGQFAMIGDAVKKVHGHLHDRGGADIHPAAVIRLLNSVGLAECDGSAECTAREHFVDCISAEAPVSGSDTATDGDARG